MENQFNGTEKILFKILDGYGIDIVNNSQRLIALISDYIWFDQKLKKLIVNSVKEKVPQRAVNLSYNKIVDFSFSYKQNIGQLAEDVFYGNHEIAKQILDIWILAIGNKDIINLLNNDTADKVDNTISIKETAVKKKSGSNTSDKRELFIQSGSTVSDICGNVYRTINIGSQIWMAENLKTTKFNNGNEIPLITNEIDWNILNKPGYCYYENNRNENEKRYGALYNWHAVNSKLLAPKGWHIPSDEEWKILEIELGMNLDEVNNIGWRGHYCGSKLAGNASLWDGELYVNGVFGESNFKAIPSGRRNHGFKDKGFDCFFWSSTKVNVSGAYIRRIWCHLNSIDRSEEDINNGFSVRCIKDA